MKSVRGENLSMSSIAFEMEGTWEECILDDCNNIFKRHKEGHKCYTLGDKIGICPLCLHQRKKENDTLPKKEGDVSEFVHHKSNDAKPEGDSL